MRKEYKEEIKIIIQIKCIRENILDEECILDEIKKYYIFDNLKELKEVRDIIKEEKEKEKEKEKINNNKDIPNLLFNEYQYYSLLIKKR